MAGQARPSVAASLLNNLPEADSRKDRNKGDKVQDARNIAGVAYAGKPLESSPLKVLSPSLAGFDTVSYIPTFCKSGFAKLRGRLWLPSRPFL